MYLKDAPFYKALCYEIKLLKLPAPHPENLVEGHIENNDVNHMMNWSGSFEHNNKKNLVNGRYWGFVYEELAKKYLKSEFFPEMIENYKIKSNLQMEFNFENF